MQRQIAAIVLCILAQTASAHWIAAPAAAKPTPTPVAAAQPAGPAAKPQAPQAARAELIKTAAAGTRDDAPPAIREGARTHGGTQDHPRRGGTAMLLAALALMSGIALRRFGARGA